MPETPPATPEQFIGFRVGTDNKLVRWDRMLEYFRLVAERVAWFGPSDIWWPLTVR